MWKEKERTGFDDAQLNQITSKSVSDGTAEIFYSGEQSTTLFLLVNGEDCSPYNLTLVEDCALVGNSGTTIGDVPGFPPGLFVGIMGIFLIVIGLFIAARNRFKMGKEMTNAKPLGS